MDVQAQDRAHRIGQTKPVLIFRLVSAHTIETHILQRATEKRKLETVVIAKGQLHNIGMMRSEIRLIPSRPALLDRFKAPTSLKGAGNESLADLAAALMKLEGEKIEVVPNTKEGKTDVLSDADLNVLLDRSPEVFEEKGETKRSGSSSKSATMERTKKGGAAAFEVYVPTKHSGNDALARMMDDEDGAIPGDELEE